MIFMFTLENSGEEKSEQGNKLHCRMGLLILTMSRSYLPNNIAFDVLRVKVLSGIVRFFFSSARRKILKEKK